MTRAPIKSSNLKAVGYDPKTNTLEVEFHTGAVHQFDDVPAGIANALVAAKSPGSYFHSEIRSGGFKSRSVA